MPRQKPELERDARSFRTYLILEFCRDRAKNEYSVMKMVQRSGKDIGKAVGSDRTIRHHLKRLLTAGILDVEGTRPGKRGSPSRQIRVYVATEQGKALLKQFHSNLDSMMELLEKLKSKSDQYPYDPKS